MNEDFSILIIDDEENQRESVGGFLRKKGYPVHTAASFGEGIDIFKNRPIDMIITDFKMPGKTGEDVLVEAQKINPTVPVVIVTAYGSVEGAVGLMRKGAFDYIQKPIDLMELLHVVDKAKERHFLISENKMLRRQLSDKYSFDSIISDSGEMEEVLNTAGRVAKSKASVLVRGESGTGKELIARAIHQASERSRGPFVVVNCAAMPETLFESELFGHEKGAFTGANKQRMGRFEQAEGGTLFIDEVGDIPMQVQVKLLRAIQFGQIERLGGSETIDLDVRIVTATNRNLEEMIAAGEFREDLYYRFNVVTINIPPLRKRRADIKPLTMHFLNKFAAQNSKEIGGISKEALDALIKYDFPGNVRELENLIQRAVVMTRGNMISTRDLPLPGMTASEGNDHYESLVPEDLNGQVEALEKNLIGQALEKTAGNQVRAAEMLGITERTLRYKMSKYGMKS